MLEVKDKPGLRTGKLIVRSALILILGAAVALPVTAITFAGTHRNTVPGVVLDWHPLDAGARAELAEQLATAQVTKGASESRAKRLAEQALLRDATQTSAARTLGMLSALRGRTEQAHRLFSYAQTLSRRDVPTQLWFVERKVQLGDIEGVLGHYDAVLRTSPQGQILLFPVLARAADQKEVFEALMKRFKARPPWARDFLTQLRLVKVNPEHMARLALAALDGSDPQDIRMLQRLLSDLVQRGEYGIAYATYQSLAGRSAAEANLRDGQFDEPPTYPPLEWQLANDADLAAIPQPVAAQDGVALHLYTRAGRGGEFARQLLRLSGGAYRISGMAAEIPQPQEQRPYVELRCADRGQDILLKRIELPWADGRAQGWQAGFRVPPDCDYQWLRIAGPGTLGAQSSAPWVDEITIEAGLSN